MPFTNSLLERRRRNLFLKPVSFPDRKLIFAFGFCTLARYSEFSCLKIARIAFNGKIHQIVVVNSSDSILRIIKKYISFNPQSSCLIPSFFHLIPRFFHLIPSFFHLIPSFFHLIPSLSYLIPSFC